MTRGITPNIVSMRFLIVSLAAIAALLGVLISSGVLPASALTGPQGVYTSDADFDEGTLINVNHDSPNNDQLQLNEAGEPFKFIWIAASSRGTIVKIDTTNGEILGEYQSAPDNRGRNPSRTTVDANGNVWSGNRDEAAGGKGSVVQVGLEENGQCVDRHGEELDDPPDGIIQTSTGLGDIKSWSNTGGVDDNGGVSTAYDECIIKYVRVSGDNVRHVSVDANNNVWTAGNFGADNSFDLVSGTTGAILASTGDLDCGGYGGLVDDNGVLWSANREPGAVSLLRYDTKNTIDTSDDTYECLDSPNAYGLGIDSSGNIWNAQYSSNEIRKFDPDGNLFAGFPTGTGGASDDRGVVVTPDDNVWVANSAGTDVSRLDNDGNILQVIDLDAPAHADGLHAHNPTGVAVDADGKVWATNLNSSTASRIDPDGGGEGVAAVDLTVDLGAGAGPYNYSDMTGSLVPAAPSQGTWTVVHDSGIDDSEWQSVSWTSDEPGDDSSIEVEVALSDDNTCATFGIPQPVANGGKPSGTGRCIEVSVSFTRATSGESPILYDLTVIANRPPDCSNAVPSVDLIWPPNHKFVPVNVLGVTDPDGDDVTITIDSIYQDEPVDTYGDGSFTPDGQGVGTDTAEVRAERSGTKKVPGDGRVYHIGFTAADGIGGVCEGVVSVGVPHDQGKGAIPVDSGPPYYDSTQP